MWNPMHFAVFFKHLPLVKYFIEELKVNVSITLPKTYAESEKDPTNHAQFPEDKIMCLMIAYHNKDGQMLQYLLERLWYFWSYSFVNHLLKGESSTEMEPWDEAIPIILQSKTLHAYFQNLSYKKRKRWVSDFIMDVTTVNTAGLGQQEF